ncbi:SDR family oxidoreductase [Dyella flava]|uniref:SDR family oxidoreductase n=1 Tax=Dyella flava TaxID=1920170 RepID=A0ABS2K3H3_9GAMM|nr:SDR family oxidoreductase [Dyella flava]MBM7125292.1 SDR family oxidoreductase [Dyella flava]GLQ50661.1 short-chain dehydrogenase [Dyella flava]
MHRSIVVTGASKGIGRIAADMLATAGWHVIGVARHAADNFPGEFLSCDLADVSATEQLAKQLAARRDVVGIVNNAGIARQEQFGAIAASDFSSMLDINLRPALVLTQAILPNMREAGFGRVVNVTSLVTKGLPFRTSYAASKAALESMTRTIAVEQAARGITANAVAPGPTETELFRSNNPVGSEGEARYLAQIPMKRVGKPQEIAALIAFLCSDQAGFITGQTIYADGGASLGASNSE